MEVYNEHEDYELYHHGIKGQRWGIRRYQNKDGSLTNAGRKKRLTEQVEGKVKRLEKRTDAKIAKMKIESKINKKLYKAQDKAAAKLAKAEKKYTVKRKGDSDNDGDNKLKNLLSTQKPKQKTTAEMSNEEIQAKIERLRLEQTLASLQPQQQSKGKAFMSSMMSEVIAPAAKSVGKSYVEKVLKDKLGLNEKDNKDDFAELKKMAQIAEQEAKIYESRNKKVTWEKASYEFEKQKKKDAEKNN